MLADSHRSIDILSLSICFCSLMATWCTSSNFPLDLDSTHKTMIVSGFASWTPIRYFMGKAIIIRCWAKMIEVRGNSIELSTQDYATGFYLCSASNYIWIFRSLMGSCICEWTLMRRGCFPLYSVQIYLNWGPLNAGCKWKIDSLEFRHCFHLHRLSITEEEFLEMGERHILDDFNDLALLVPS